METGGTGRIVNEISSKRVGRDQTDCNETWDKGSYSSVNVWYLHECVFVFRPGGTYLQGSIVYRWREKIRGVFMHRGSTRKRTRRRKRRRKRRRTRRSKCRQSNMRKENDLQCIVMCKQTDQTKWPFQNEGKGWNLFQNDRATCTHVVLQRLSPV